MPSPSLTVTSQAANTAPDLSKWAQLAVVFFEEPTCELVV
jgi:hypothetical protein